MDSIRRDLINIHITEKAHPGVDLYKALRYTLRKVAAHNVFSKESPWFKYPG